ncbi:MFS transporter [Planctomonas sp. JC2975]|uniref:MFS transporter n=1 Tax=Planctomonas sp. JC2975 TaxID=2729626 RepID=UPI003211F505
MVATHAAGPGSGARAMGVIGTGGSLATVLGVPAGTVISQAFGWRGTFWSLAVAATVVAILIACIIPHDAAASGRGALRSSMSGLLSGRLWLALLACLTTSGGVLATYTFITPILTQQAGIPAAYVPAVLTGFGIGSLVGTLLGGRFGDAHPGLITILVPATTSVILLLIATVATAPAGMIGLVVLLGLFGLSANGVLIHLAVHHAGPAAPLGSALSVSAFNAGTAITTPIAGAALGTPLGIHGPSIIGAIIVSLTLIPTITLAVLRKR